MKRVWILDGKKNTQVVEKNDFTRKKNVFIWIDEKKKLHNNRLNKLKKQIKMII